MEDSLGLLKGTGALDEAWKTGKALGAFSTYSLEVTSAICRAAERVGKPAILQVGSSAFAYADRTALIAASMAAATESQALVGVHLDHCRDIDEVRVALDAGYTSVMVDGSHMSFAENVGLTGSVVQMAAAYDAWVEGELGGISGNEDRSLDVEASALTDPEAAARFVQDTGVDALAVSVGNVHGLSATPGTLDIERLSAINAVAGVPLVLHGASGVPDSILLAAVRSGAAKVNFNTELRRAFLSNIDVQGAPSRGWAFADVFEPARQAVQRVVEDRLVVVDGSQANSVATAR